MVSESEIGRKRKLLLGIGYFVQGLRCFPWMGMNFFLKDGMRVAPATLQILQNSANLPMVAKPLYGILSDSFYVFGEHRIPYIAFGAFLQAVSWMAIAIFAASGISFASITFYLLLGNLGASIVEVANDAMVAETAKQPISSSKKPKSSSSGGLQSFVWMASSIGGVLGNLIGGILIDRFPPRMMFLIYGILLSFQFLITGLIRETTLALPKSSSLGFRKQLSELFAALKKPDILYAIIWFAFSYAVIPALTGTMFFYQTQHLKIESSLLGISKVVGQAAMLLWGAVYNRHLKSISSRKLIVAVQGTMVVFMVSDYLFVKGFYQNLGIPDSLYVIIFSGLLEVLYFFKILPFSVLMAQLCPPGCEGSIMAFVMSAIALAFIVSGYLGVALASYFGVSGDDFSGLPGALMVQAACTLVPIFWASCVPDDVKAKGKSKKN
ncbi:probable folate-biopterin transporter 7 [Salvia miltiorrhiza]|uniref:probable folate-biopterin transporter 7 n=1 Tax=Salvia miltiorrhiza TaxID=226208 RepID=UPI0025AD8D4A|nr:probable folate-biopterin transporter 7 [Salvia miltiorrhiza]XP_057807806.1 probable folate-biopterin transporter 7 [Salvia miltiorrhiza]XP_057807807.1 probable folate-biopterin transporter 7 [Salvia miltiorrhiza]